MISRFESTDTGIIPIKIWRGTLRKLIKRKNYKTHLLSLMWSYSVLISSEVFVWISAHLRFHKKIFWIDFESEISKVEVNFSVKSVRVLKCLHNFRIKQQSWLNKLIQKLGTTNVFWNVYSVWAFSMRFFTFLSKSTMSKLWQNYWSFYPSEPFSLDQFNMIHKVFQQHIITEQMAAALSIYGSDIKRRLQFKNKQTETCFELNCDR